MHLLAAAVLTMADVERAAVANAPAVIAARERVREQRAVAALTGASRMPHAFANYVQAPQGGTIGTITQRLTTVGGQFALGDFAGTSAALAQARSNVQLARAQEIGAREAERMRAIGLFFDAIRTTEIERLRERIVAAAQADRRAARLRYAAGAAPRLDIVRADVALANAQAGLARARADRDNALGALRLETGTQGPALVLPSLASAGIGEPPAIAPAAAVGIGLRLRPEVLAARAGVAAEEAAVVAAERARLPGFTAQLGYTAGVDGGLNVKGPSANLSLDVPLSGAGADRVAAERARLAQARARLTGAQQLVQGEIEAAIRSSAADREALVAAARARDEAAAEVTATATGYRNGASSSLDLQNARSTYAQAAIDAATAAATLDRAVATLHLVMGENR